MCVIGEGWEKLKKSDFMPGEWVKLQKKREKGFLIKSRILFYLQICGTKLKSKK